MNLVVLNLLNKPRTTLVVVKPDHDNLNNYNLYSASTIGSDRYYSIHQFHFWLSNVYALQLLLTFYTSSSLVFRKSLLKTAPNCWPKVRLDTGP